MEFSRISHRLVCAAHHDVVDLDVRWGSEDVEGAGGDGFRGEHLDALAGLFELVFASGEVFVEKWSVDEAGGKGGDSDGRAVAL